MRSRVYSTPSLLLVLSLTCVPLCSSSLLSNTVREDSSPVQVARAACTYPPLTLLAFYTAPNPSPECGPPISANALRNSAYLPAQIGGIIGSYALSLVIVASILLCFSKRRRNQLAAGDEYPDLAEYLESLEQFAFPKTYNSEGKIVEDYYPYAPQSPRSPIKNFSYPTPLEIPQEQYQTTYTLPPDRSTSTLGVNPNVDQRVVAADRAMAQQQLEDMYKYVMEHEAAKEAGSPIEAPPTPLAKSHPTSTPAPPLPAPGKSILKKGKNKPANLDLSTQPEKQSRASSILSALKSPGRKKNPKGINISSPIMTPMSSTFPRQDSQEMNVIPPRHYAPASPPPIPLDQHPYMGGGRKPSGIVEPLTPPDMSPESTQSIDERLGAQYGHSRMTSDAPSEYDPVSATSERSTTPLVGLPSSPKPGVNRFPTLPSSPKPGATFPGSPRGAGFPASPRGDTFPLSPALGQTFSRPNAPSAVRTGGALPLRAYEPALTSPSAQTTKQTTFERSMPLSPGMRTPWTGAPQPYTPYQPFSPVIPVTPSLVTKADRKRMKQLQPKTPTVEMVQSSDDIW
ncbi:hypothetical protein F5Y16DRAFT_379161 [Xylariaceae sp. FL0255]|nr:hypothetical protein F5Y16DRAFT_379161 [Xylariaceae sp. FL0255]